MDELKDGAFKPATRRFYDRLGFGAGAFVFGGIILWSIAAPIDGAIIAGGQIVVESNRKSVQHLEGGVIRDILVQEGDLVQKDAVVVRLDDTVQKTNAALIDSQLAENYARRARLEAERDSVAMTLSKRGAADVIASAVFSENLEGQQRLFDARHKTRITQVSLLKERITQQNDRISGLNAQINAMGDQLTLIDEQLTGVRELYGRGFATKTRMSELEREARRLAGERGALEAGVAEATSVIAEANLEIERLRESGREEAIAELRELEVAIAELEERRVTAVDALHRTEIRAPQSGRILSLSTHTVGGVIAPGAALMEIVPDGDRLQVAARIAPQDVDKIQAGQETLVRFSAFGAQRTPEALGRVRTVSADARTDQVTGVPYYLVIVEIPDGEHLTGILAGEQLLPGMPVEAFIRTGSKSAIAYLLKPLTDSFARSLRED